MIIAYLLWLFLGGLSMHRFFLGRILSAFLQIGLYLGGSAVVISSVWTNGGLEALESEAAMRDAVSSGSLILGALMIIVWSLWWMIDAVLIALMVMEDERKSEAGQGYDFNPQSVSLDPSHQATRQAAGRAPGATKSGIPDDYVMPWRQKKDDEREIYKARGD